MMHRQTLQKQRNVYLLCVQSSCWMCWMMIIAVPKRIFTIIARSCSPPLCLGHVRILSWASPRGINEDYYYVGLTSELDMRLYCRRMEQYLSKRIGGWPT